MPLKYIRARVPRVTVDDALNIAVISASTTQQLANLSQFPAVSTAASILLAIFQTIQNVQTNKNDCYRLARRCLALLVDIQEQIDGRREDTPESLTNALSKLEGYVDVAIEPAQTIIVFFRTLQSIHEYMKSEAENKWHNRLMRKSSIETALRDYNAAPDDAARSFQIATLINIHYAVDDRTNRHITDVEDLTSRPVRSSFGETPEMSIASTKTSEEFTIVQRSDQSCPVFTEPRYDGEPEQHLLDHHGFRRYHQSELVLKGRSRIKEGWWAGASESLVKRYEGIRRDALKNWLRDVKILQNVFRPNLPQMIGYSHEENPTPFILLANARLPQALVLGIIKDGSLASCATLLIRLCKATLDAALYLQRQLNLTDSKIQDYVEYASFRIDGEETLVMGLPPPEIDRIQSCRNFGLAHSVKKVYLQLLPNRGHAKQPNDPADTTVDTESQQKMNHLALLVQALLPSSADTAAVSSYLNALLGDDIDDEHLEEGLRQLTLRQIRIAVLTANNHRQTWRQSTVTPYKYTVGDLGYIPRGRDFRSFTVLCNILQEDVASLSVTQNVDGNQWSWGRGPVKRQTLQPSSFPNGVSGWTIIVPAGTKQNLQIVHESLVVSPDRAWRYLLDHGKHVADSYGLDPQDLILVTTAGVDMRLYVHDLRPMHHHPMSTAHIPSLRTPMFAPQHGKPHVSPAISLAAHHAYHNSFPPELPAAFYLFTAMEKNYEPYWSETPFYVPLQNGANPHELKARCWTGLDQMYGYLNYVQLHAEDFAS
ncbi:hypothetical protein B0H21DRAFT_237381 [Amylocystis lapponica]|nr:hypothetical protein B0H21DRAFT_237381 [Amylocystis lapponica]